MTNPLSKPISAFDPIEQPLGHELVPVVADGQNMRTTVAAIRQGVTKQMLNLERVNNTSDEDKPISTATQQALDQKAETNHTHGVQEIEGLSETIQQILSQIPEPTPSVATGIHEW
jgi:hypothetical protein